MLDKGMRQADLARSTGLSTGYISEVVGGRKPFTAPVLAKLANALGLSVAWLARGEGHPDDVEPPGAVVPRASPAVSSATETVGVLVRELAEVRAKSELPPGVAEIALHWPRLNDARRAALVRLALELRLAQEREDQQGQSASPDAPQARAKA